MPRPSQLNEKRKELLPIIARAFTELGYRRTTTAELGKRCGVRENILYRLWPNKKAMFIAAIDYVFDLSAATWGRILAACESPEEGGLRLLDYESKHQGEFGHYRIVFAGLSEADDPDIRAALQRMFGRFQRFVASQIEAGRPRGGRLPDASLSAWAMLGLGTAANITRELELLGDRQRQRLIASVGRQLLDGSPG